jgi:hypothetical protein
MTFTPRFGEITNYDWFITESVCNNLKDEMKLDKNVWFILHTRIEYFHHESQSMTSPGGWSKDYKIYLFDNYLNEYEFYYCNNNFNILKILNNDNKLYFPPQNDNDRLRYSMVQTHIKNIKNNCKYDTPLSDEEITYIRDYCNKEEFEDMIILKNKMKLHITLQKTLNNYEIKLSELEGNYNTLLNNNKLFKKSLEEKFITILKQNETLLESNKKYESSIQELNTKINKLEKLQKEDSTFMSYLKNLFVWN